MVSLCNFGFALPSISLSDLLPSFSIPTIAIPSITLPMPPCLADLF